MGCDALDDLPCAAGPASLYKHVVQNAGTQNQCCLWQALEEFVTKARLGSYEKSRNDPNADAVSSLSPYIHFGQLAPARCALDAGKMKTSCKVRKTLKC